MSLEELGDFDGALEDIVFHILSTQVQFHLPIIGIVWYYLCLRQHPNMDLSAYFHYRC